LKNSTEKDFVFEDISSTSPSFRKEIISASKDYGNGAFRHIDIIIKIIAFIVAIIVLVVFFGIAAVLMLLDQSFKVIALAVVIVGVILSLITLFLIFGLGHIITLNKQILKRL